MRAIRSPQRATHARALKQCSLQLPVFRQTERRVSGKDNPAEGAVKFGHAIAHDDLDDPRIKDVSKRRTLQLITLAALA
ncbi:hypothetical protein EVG20_g6892 [Dentipellis fragilis]|uniref:Uncharacterized protein n=1 Tax=Dentipellis fragilis TaxID=205917 RepID=A0A4Y9YHR0_9AGAM|nr:hypothetical protein EVG20_g6892 [Dentipellis fragilis]